MYYPIINLADELHATLAFKYFVVIGSHSFINGTLLLLLGESNSQ